MVLIEVAEGEDFVELVKDEIASFEEWFSDLSVWSTEQGAKERYAWVRCQGAPFHAWGEDFFRMVATGVGRFVYVDTLTAKKQRCDVARILVQPSSPEVVNQLVKVKINGVIYSIKLVDEPFTNPFIHIGDVYKHGSKLSSSSSSASGEIGSEAWMSMEGVTKFKIF